MVGPPPCSPLFPSTALFRSGQDRHSLDPGEKLAHEPALPDAGLAVDREDVGPPAADRALERVLQQLQLSVSADEGRGQRSEEHTSELQSQSNLVCRLLLEKK